MPLSHRIRMPGFPDCEILDVAGPMQMFAGANDELGWPDYDLRTAAPKTGPFRTSSGMRLVDLAYFSLVPEAFGAMDTAIAATPTESRDRFNPTGESRCPS